MIWLHPWSKALPCCLSFIVNGRFKCKTFKSKITGTFIALPVYVKLMKGAFQNKEYFLRYFTGA